MKIMHICSNFGSLHRDLILKQEEAGLDPYAFFYTTRHRDFDRTYFPEGRVHSFNSPVRFFRTPLFFRKRINIAAGYFLEFHKNNRDYDILHAHMLFTDGDIAYRASREFPVPYIVTVRSADMDCWWGWRIGRNRERGFEILKNASAVIFLSPVFRDELLGRLPPSLAAEVAGKTCLIPNGIDYFWHWNRLPSHKNQPKNEVRILTAGKINKRKNQLSVLKALEMLAAGGINVRYTVVGEDESRKMTGKLGKSSITTVLPPCTKETLLQIYRDSDIFVLPSMRETFGLVYAEAMTQGLPVIYSMGQGFDGQFPEGEAGYAADPSSPESVRDAVLKVMGAYEEISVRCLRLSRKFRWGTIVDAQKDMYSMILERRQPSISPEQERV